MSALKLPPFEYFEPTTVSEATALLTKYGGDARVLAGGVDLLPRMRAGSVKAGHLVNISVLPVWTTRAGLPKEASSSGR